MIGGGEREKEKPKPLLFLSLFLRTHTNFHTHTRALSLFSLSLSYLLSFSLFYTTSTFKKHAFLHYFKNACRGESQCLGCSGRKCPCESGRSRCCLTWNGIPFLLFCHLRAAEERKIALINKKSRYHVLGASKWCAAHMQAVGMEYRALCTTLILLLT